MNGKDRSRAVIIVLSFIGFIVAAYLTYLYYNKAETSFCVTGSSCDIVRLSGYSSIDGIPVSLIGLIGYFGLFIITVSNIPDRIKWLTLYFISLPGLVFSIYLTYVEVFVLKAICSFCLLSAIVITAIFILILFKKPIVLRGKVSKILPISIFIVIIVILGSLFFKNSGELRATAANNYQVGLAIHLRETGATMYGSFQCPHCLAQKHFFGTAFKFINYVECDPKGENADPSLCISKGVTSYPTWEIGGKFYLGAKSLKELSRISGYNSDNTEDQN
jgi:uncharacterized membrane protein